MIHINLVQVGSLIKCNRLDRYSEPILEVVEIVNDPYYKLPNVKVIDSSINRVVMITDFEIVQI